MAHLPGSNCISEERFTFACQEPLQLAAETHHSVLWRESCLSMRSALNCKGIDLIYVEKDGEGYDTLSLNIYDVCLNRLVVMRQNDWLARTDVDEIEAAPRTPRLVINSSIHRVNLSVDFIDRDRMKSQDLKVAEDFNIPASDNVLMIRLKGEFSAPCHAIFDDDGLSVNNRFKFSGSYFGHYSKGLLWNNIGVLQTSDHRGSPFKITI